MLVYEYKTNLSNISTQIRIYTKLLKYNILGGNITVEWFMNIKSITEDDKSLIFIDIKTRPD